MPMLACIHSVSWVVPLPGGQHQCLYCRATVAKKDLYPKWDELGLAYQQKWEAHEKGPAPAPAADGAKPAA